MIRVRYTGPVVRLQGETALARMSASSVALDVQFDNLTLPESGGWQELPAHHFQAVPEPVEAAAA